MCVVIFCLAMMSKLTILTALLSQNFQEQLYKTAFLISKEKRINKFMELLWHFLKVSLWKMNFYVSMNRFGLMNDVMSSSLHNIEWMLMTYFFCFVHLITLKNSKTVWFLNIETLDLPVRKNRIILCVFRHFNYQNQ